MAALRQPHGRREPWRQLHEQQQAVQTYLAHGSSDGFLRAYVAADPQIYEEFDQLDSPVRYDKLTIILGRLHQAHLLPEEFRRRAIDRMKEIAVSSPDASWIDDEDWQLLLTDADREALFEHVLRRLVPYLEIRVENWAAESSGDVGDAEVENALRSYEEAFKERQDTKDTNTASRNFWAIDSYQQMRPEPEESADDWTPKNTSLRERLLQLRQSSGNQRSLFDDINQ
ncbi:hypothetical protein RM572_28355 [Streptomyces sp. DSM 42041]|uniref:Uncharacterized protein n=1 Tax=Streptomyces hazeniae TaxID=3075538 RepID=A0ABU2P396_9ACTN|nr:hypothetical protein [Streptomyces sp. DSM 42041]MDT0382667.1 hypothetical protein [Streptomyces sp. DSM 42041]